MSKISGVGKSKISGDEINPKLCSLPKVPKRVLPEGIESTRARLIRELEKKWVNGTVLPYCFLDQPPEFAGGEEEKRIVRGGFDAWKNLGIGIKFEEVSNPDEAKVRIGFLADDGYWSFIGRDILNKDFTDQTGGRTMNFDLNELKIDPRGIDVPTHEIGHTLGFPHEHQNPKAGIKWNEDAVYDWAERTQGWNKEETDRNIISKIDPDKVEGSSWDPDSIMHYAFKKGLIIEPEKYRNGLTPAGRLSERDITWVKTYYPLLDQPDYVELTIDTPVPLALSAREQKDFLFVPEETRTYDMATEGESDTVMVLFEEKNGQKTQLAANDDSATDINAHIQQELTQGNRYVLSIRLYHEWVKGDTTVKVW